MTSITFTSMVRQARQRFNPRNRIADTAASLFTHADYPLADSLDYPGDPGLFGPDSSTWPVIGDVATMLGGIRALLIQSAHPEVVAGVAEHSDYRSDALGRLSRTTSYVTATSYGAMPEVEAAIGRVRSSHVPIEGTSHRGRHYSAGNADHASWVHNVLTDSFLVSFQTFGPTNLSDHRADHFVGEQSRLGAMLRARDLPQTADELSLWIGNHPELESSPGAADTVDFLRNPPLPRSVRPVYGILFRAAVATIPTRILKILDLDRQWGSIAAGQRTISLMRWSLGSSPSWWLALQRMEAHPPSGVTFRRAPPAAGARERFGSPPR